MSDQQPAAAAKRCENCGDAMAEPDDFGTEQDGSRSEQFCGLCYRDGVFQEGLPGQGDALSPR